MTPLPFRTAAEAEAALGRAVTHLRGGGPRPGIVLGCGPERMLESLVRVTRREGLRCEVSLERRHLALLVRIVRGQLL